MTQFENPPKENRIRPFWFANGDMDKNEVKKQILEMKQKGLGGFFFCARQGLTIPYLSADWFSLCRSVADEAQKAGLEVWLYDEYPYPSGMSGGEVTIQHPETRQTELVFTDTHAEGNSVVSLSLGRVSVLSAFAYPFNGGKTDWLAGIDIAASVGILQNTQIYRHTVMASAVHNHKRYFTYGPGKELRWNAPSGTWRIIVAAEKPITDFKYYGDFLDPANPLAVETFIKTTYEPYKNALGDYFGDTIKGMFGDETGYLGIRPWSGMLQEYCQKRFGLDLSHSLAGILDDEYPDAPKIRYHYFQCLHELLRDNYHKRLSEWCAKNHLRYVTEVPSLRMSNEMYSHVPGGDCNHDKLGFPLEKALNRDFVSIRSNAKAVSAIARQCNRRDSLIESFHSIGWSMTLQDAKWQIDRETLMGVSFHNFHAFYYSMDGLTKHDAPPSQFFQNPYWALYKPFADYCARSSRYITETESSARVAVFHPATTWWTAGANTMLRMSYIGGDSEKEKRAKAVIDDYVYICKSLFFSQVDYDDLDAEILALGRIENGIIAVGKARYDTVIVPPVTNIEKYALTLLKQFADSGGNVIFCGLTPYEKIERIDECAGPRIFFENNFGTSLTGDVYFGETGTASLSVQGNIHFLNAPGGLAASEAGGLLARTVKTLSPPRTKLYIPAEVSHAVAASRREDTHADYVLFSSQDGAASLCTVESAIPGRVFVEFDLETGEVFRLESENTLAVSISPWQTRLIAAMDAKEAANLPVKPAEPVAVKPLPVYESFPVTLKGPNIFRLDRPRLSVDGSDFRPVEPHLFVEQARSVSLIDASKHLTFDGGFGLPLRPQMKYPIEARYRLDFAVEKIPAHAELMHDQNGITGSYTIRVNGAPLAAPRSRFIYDRNNLASDITAILRQGLNTVEVDVTVSEDWHGLNDPFYILGDFGVWEKDGGFVIGAAPDKVIPAAKIAQGFPFYSGEFTVSFPLALPKEAVKLTLPAGIYECFKLKVDGKDRGARSFAPYAWTIPADGNRPDTSRLELTIVNTLINMLEGSYFDYSRGETIAISSTAGRALVDKCR